METESHPVPSGGAVNEPEYRDPGKRPIVSQKKVVSRLVILTVAVVTGLLLADRGQAHGKAQCATCHVPPLFTEPGWNMHTADEIGIDDFQASRSPDDRYRTPPLKGLWAHTKGGFYHDGRFATLNDVVDHYNSFFKVGPAAQEKSDLVEYLKSL